MDLHNNQRHFRCSTSTKHNGKYQIHNIKKAIEKFQGIGVIMNILKSTKNIGKTKEKKMN